MGVSVINWSYVSVVTCFCPAIGGFLHYMESGGTVTITGFTSCQSELTPTAVIPDTIDSMPVVGIGSNAFKGCTSLTSVAIPDSVTIIGYYAFENCTDLTSVTIGNSVTSIGNYAFYNCTGLTSVTIPDSVTSIGGYAFYNCKALTSVTIPTALQALGVMRLHIAKL